MELMINIAVWTLVAVIGVLGAFLLFSTVSIYSPPKIMELSAISTPDNFENAVPKSFSILTWNVGYAGLDASEDFFMDGGTMSMPPSKEIVEKNMVGIKDFLSSHRTDFISLQEVDKNSARSYGVDEIGDISKMLKKHFGYYALNYKVNFVPVPLSHPMGNVESGVAVFTKYKPLKVERWAFPGDYSWPVNLFQLKRCFIASWYKVKDSNKKLVYVNLHLSAFDKGGTLRKKQLDYLKEFMLSEYKKGNYVIVGGDWNNMMPGITLHHFKFTTPLKYLDIYINFPENWTPKGWKWAYDPSTPSLRSDEKPYVKGENFTTIIDGFLVSPNVDVLSVKAFDLEFKNSDHNPVEMEVKLEEQ
jgi:endonuclease/exonuclease/phosphatase family metal-dependent hydrolase